MNRFGFSKLSGVVKRIKGDVLTHLPPLEPQLGGLGGERGEPPIIVEGGSAPKMAKLLPLVKENKDPAHRLRLISKKSKKLIIGGARAKPTIPTMAELSRMSMSVLRKMAT